MKKTIVIKNENGEIEIPLKATIKAMQLYRTEFGSDLSRDLAAVYDTLHPDPYLDAMKRAGIVPGELTHEEMQQKILENLDYSMIRVEDPIPDEETQIKTLRITWAMAKAADPDCPDCEKWIDTLDTLPIRSLAECIQGIWREANSTTVIIKN